MKEILYWLLVVFCSIMILFLLSTFFSGSELETSFTTNFLYLLLSVGALIYGIRKIRAKDIEEKQMQTIEYTGNLNLNFSGQISFKDYRNTSLEVYFKQRWFTSVFILLFMIMLLTFENIDFAITLIIAMWAGILLAFPLLVIRSAKKLYKQNKTFQEKLTYHLDNEKITIVGETVNTTFNWSRLFKITETRTFFLLYQDSLIADFLDKKMFTEEEIIEFRKFVNSLNIRKELKKK